MRDGGHEAVNVRIRATLFQFWHSWEGASAWCAFDWAKTLRLVGARATSRCRSRRGVGPPGVLPRQRGQPPGGSSPGTRAISRRGSFRAAALELGMSATALSSAIGKLEAALGVRLFNRTTRSVSLSNAGRLFVETVRPALQEIHGALEVVRSRQQVPSGTLRTNAFAEAAREILSPLVLEYLRRHPQVHIDLVTEGRLVDIVAEGFDVGVRVADLVPSDMIAVSLGRPHRYAVVGSLRYFKEHPKPIVPPDLLNHSCIRVRLPNGAPFRWQFEKAGRTAQIDVTGPITLDEVTLARTAVLEGVGLGFFMEQSILADVEKRRMVRVLADWTPPFAGLCLYYPGSRKSLSGAEGIRGPGARIQGGSAAAKECKSWKVGSADMQPPPRAAAAVGTDTVDPSLEAGVDLLGDDVTRPETVALIRRPNA